MLIVDKCMHNVMAIALRAVQVREPADTEDGKGKTSLAKEAQHAGPKAFRLEKGSFSHHGSIVSLGRTLYERDMASQRSSICSSLAVPPIGQSGYLTEVKKAE